MHELSAHNIEQIAKDISSQDVCFSHLLDELIDHVCCDVESEMSKGVDFDEAYCLVIQKIGSGRFREIQKETLFAVDTKYRRMKNTMKISGIAGTILFGFAAMFKIQHWPMAGVMLTLGSVVLSLVFLPSSLGVLWKETHNRTRLFLFVSAFLTGLFFITGTLFKIQHWPQAGIILSAGLLVTLFMLIPSLIVFLFRDKDKISMRPLYLFLTAGFILYICGLLFKIQHWPMATILLGSGTIILGFIVLPWYTVSNWKNDEFVSNRFIFIIVAILLIFIPGLLINLNLQNQYEDGFYLNQKSQQALGNYLYQHNITFADKYRDSTGYSNLVKIHSGTENVLTKIGELEKMMIQESEGQSLKPAVSERLVTQGALGTMINYGALSKPFHPAPVKDFLLPGCASRKELENVIAEYVESISELVSQDETNRYKSLLDTKGYLPESLPEDGSIPMMLGLHSLELLRNNVLLAESDLFKALTNNRK